MKVININYNRYKYPKDITGIDSFIDFINHSEKQFTAMIQFDEENCVFPYLVKEDIKTVFINFSNVTEIFEEEANLLCRADYEEKLAVCVKRLCLSCEYYEEDDNDNMRGHRGKLCLDGTCCYYNKKVSFYND